MDGYVVSKELLEQVIEDILQERDGRGSVALAESVAHCVQGQPVQIDACPACHGGGQIQAALVREYGDHPEVGTLLCCPCEAGQALKAEMQRQYTKSPEYRRKMQEQRCLLFGCRGNNLLWDTSICRQCLAKQSEKVLLQVRPQWLFKVVSHGMLQAINEQLRAWPWLCERRSPVFEAVVSDADPSAVEIVFKGFTHGVSVIMPDWSLGEQDEQE